MVSNKLGNTSRGPLSDTEILVSSQPWHYKKFGTKTNVVPLKFWYYPFLEHFCNIYEPNYDDFGTIISNTIYNGTRETFVPQMLVPQQYCYQKHCHRSKLGNTDKGNLVLLP